MKDTTMIRESILRMAGGSFEERMDVEMARVVENILSITKINSDVAKIRKEQELAEEIASSAVNKFHRRYPDIPFQESI